MGRVGKSAYRALEEEVGDYVAGLDSDRKRAWKLREDGMRILIGDGEDADFWQAFDTSEVRLVLLALPAMDDIRNICYQLRVAGFEGPVAAIARYEDDRAKLLEYGIDHVFNFYKEAGTGFAEDSLRLIQRVPVSAH
jgi:Trk K+ transport system NAD-binding subunit